MLIILLQGVVLFYHFQGLAVGLVVLCVKYWLGKEQKLLLQIRM
jgi:hypothetical protein